MTKTFAQHLLALCPDSETRAVARSNSKRASAPATADHSATTYASVVLMLAMGTSGAHAANDGVTTKNGGSSSAALDIGLVIPERLDITGLASPRLQSDRRGGLTGTSSACVSGLGSGQYHLSALGSGKNGAFESSDGKRNLPYTVTYSDAKGAPKTLTMGQALRQLTGSGATTGCEDNAANAQLSIHLPDLPQSASQATASPIAGVRGALTLVLSPE